MISVGNTILNVALPTVQVELDASSSELQWIVDGYLLVYAGLLLAAGTLGDRFGRRRALVTGLLVFAAGSVLAALSDGSSALIASRALMGVGAAGIMPTTLSILTNMFPANERPKAIAIWTAVAGMGVAIGPILSLRPDVDQHRPGGDRVTRRHRLEPPQPTAAAESSSSTVIRARPSVMAERTYRHPRPARRRVAS